MRIIVSVEATPHEGEPFTEEDLFLAVQAACNEVHPVRDGMPVVTDVVMTSPSRELGAPDDDDFVSRDELDQEIEGLRKEFQNEIVGIEQRFDAISGD